MSESVVQEIAARNGVSAATVLISYHVNNGVAVLPKSTTKERIISNSKIIALSSTDLAILNNLVVTGNSKRLNTPLWGSDLGFADWYGSDKME